MFCFFDLEACEILSPPPWIKPVLPALEGEILTTGPPGQFLPGIFDRCDLCQFEQLKLLFLFF